MGDLACQFIHSRQASLRDKGLRISQELQGLESSAPANCHRQEPVTLVKRDHNGPRFFRSASFCSPSALRHTQEHLWRRTVDYIDLCYP